MAGIDQATLGERLRIARAAVGLTQDEVAKALEIARTTVVAIERGERPVRPEELPLLAVLYKTSVNALLRRDAVHVDLVAQFRRPMGAKVSAEEATAAVRLLHQLAASTVELERRLGKSPALQYPPERKIGRGQLDQQAEDLALELRNQLGLGLGPITDIFAIAELDLGMRIFIRPLASGIAGVFAYHPELGACVVLNANHRRTRQAWTLAHEIAHLLTSRSEAEVCASDGQKAPTERFADLFAAAFLMPAPTVRRRFSETTDAEGKFSTRHLYLLAHRLHVSVEAICRRLENLRLLPSGTIDRVRASAARGTLREILVDESQVEEPAPVPPRLATLAVEAHGRGLLSEGQVAQMLAVDRIEARRLIDELQQDDDDLVGEP